MYTLQAVVIGIVTGILTTVLLFFVKQFIQKVAIPWYQELIYQGVDLSGAWKNEYSGEKKRTKFKLILDQSAHKLKGSLLFIQKEKDKDMESSGEFSVEGYLWEGYATLNFRPKNRKTLSYAAALLKVCNGGTTLQGYLNFRDLRKKDEVVSMELKLQRG